MKKSIEKCGYKRREDEKLIQKPPLTVQQLQEIAAALQKQYNAHSKENFLAVLQHERQTQELLLSEFQTLLFHVVENSNSTTDSKAAFLSVYSCVDSQILRYHNLQRHGYSWAKQLVRMDNLLLIIDKLFEYPANLYQELDYAFSERMGETKINDLIEDFLTRYTEIKKSARFAVFFS